MIIREAKREDIPQIQIVRNSVKENTLSDPSLVTDADCEEYMTVRGKGWVCEIDGKLVGFAIIDLKENNVWALFISPDYEKKGIGRRLHATMMEWYFTQTSETVWLGTAYNTRAEKFYRKAGWLEVGTHGSKEIKFEMTHDDWVKNRKAVMAIIKYYILSFIYLLTLPISAQIITQKNGKYGINNLSTGDLLVEQRYDTIYQLRLRPRVIDSGQDVQSLPIFACINNKHIQLYNSNSVSFYEGDFDEIKLYRQIDEQGYGLNPPKYIPYWVDCFMLRKGNNWGFISYKKEYGFHDKLEESDTFNIIEPQYDDLKYIEEEYGYDSKKYTRKRRVIAAKKDSLWGAVCFETGEVIVPFNYKLPIHNFRNSYDNRGLEFFSTQGGFIPYYVARNSWDTKPQLVINPQHPDVWCEFDFLPLVHIYNEFSNQYLYIEPQKGQDGFFQLFEYSTGKLLLSYKRDICYVNFQTYRKIENILIIDESTPYENLFCQTWFNLATGKEILYAEGKSYKDTDFNLSCGNDLIVMKGRKVVGKILGEGDAMQIQWTTKKVYTKEAIMNK